MTRIATFALAVLGVTAGFAPAQVIIVQQPPRAVTYTAPPVILETAPIVTNAPTVLYGAPPVTYSYYAPPASTFSASPSYYAVPASYYSVPASTVYYAPSEPAVFGVVTTRSYVGLGIFRPRGVYTESYFTPAIR